MTEPFRFSSGQLAYSVQELVGVCQQFPQEGITYLKRGDFEKWLAYIGEGELSLKTQKLRQTSVNDTAKLNQFLELCQSKQADKLASTQPSDKTSTPPKPSVNALQSILSFFTGKKSVSNDSN
jgi:hypothetical protein